MYSWVLPKNIKYRLEIYRPFKWSLIYHIPIKIIWNMSIFIKKSWYCLLSNLAFFILILLFCCSWLNFRSFQLVYCLILFSPFELTSPNHNYSWTNLPVIAFWRVLVPFPFCRHSNRYLFLILCLRFIYALLKVYLWL